MFISYTRDGFNEFNISGNYLFSFLKQQGVSFYVTAMGIEFNEEFKQNILYYLILELIAAFASRTLSMPGNSFATDLTIKINNSAYLMGFGTGSSYLAEAYLLGGPFMVFVVTFLIGYSLSRLTSIFTQVNIYFKILIFTAIQYIIYLPRDMLLIFISHLIKVAIYVTILYISIIFIKSIINVLRSRNYEISTTN